MEGRYLQLSDITSYNAAFIFANKVWDEVLGWNYFARDTIGKQFVNAADSISANIAEGLAAITKRIK